MPLSRDTMMHGCEHNHVNAWGTKVPEPRSVHSYPATCGLLKRMLRRFWLSLNVAANRTDELCNRLFEEVRAYQGSEQDLESVLRRLVTGVGDSNAVKRALSERTDLILRQITPFIKGPRVLDFGCGDGEVGRRLCDRLRVDLADVMDYRSPESRGLPFTPLSEGTRAPYRDGHFDTVLALTVFHHCKDVRQAIHEAIRIATRRVLVIESVFGIHPTTRLRVLDGIDNNSDTSSEGTAFALLSREEQLAYCSFIDWFYNRVLHEGVPVPLNFNTPARWKKAFASAGAKQIAMYHLGLDQVTVPEFHTLHILEPVHASCQ